MTGIARAGVVGLGLLVGACGGEAAESTSPQLGSDSDITATTTAPAPEVADLPSCEFPDVPEWELESLTEMYLNQFGLDPDEASAAACQFQHLSDEAGRVEAEAQEILGVDYAGIWIDRSVVPPRLVIAITEGAGSEPAEQVVEASRPFEIAIVERAVSLEEGRALAAQLVEQLVSAGFEARQFGRTYHPSDGVIELKYVEGGVGADGRQRIDEVVATFDSPVPIVVSAGAASVEAAVHPSRESAG
ncbi:MAG: hypothetical protein S0880_36990 [Actinomycetota bacterium]|nr:hypothetical protein [Actinomycetota bacterium]